MPKIRIGNVMGPPGPKGDPGKTGPIGPEGPPGPEGNINSGSAVSFTEALTRENIKSGESCATIFGKIKKFFTDLKTVAFTGSYSDLSNKPTLGSAAGKDVANNLTTSDSSYVLDARQGKALNEAKLDKKNVVNNLTTTEEGYALDARQGKNLNGKIEGLKSDLGEVGKFRSVSGSASSVYQGNCFPCQITLPKGIYLLLATVDLTVGGSVSATDLMSLGFKIKTPETCKFLSSDKQTRTTTLAGGGLMNYALFECTGEATIAMQCYGYMNKQYQHRGNISAITIR